jgi:hypothetical protein
MSPADTPLTRDRILPTAEDVVRRFGPAKTTMIDLHRSPPGLERRGQVFLVHQDRAQDAVTEDLFKAITNIIW